MGKIIVILIKHPNLFDMKRIILTLTLITISASVFSQNTNERPKVIGISCGISSSGTNTLSNNYVEAIRKAGGIPILLPVMADSLQAAGTIALLDGVLLSGGEDIDPDYYGETPVNGTVQVNARRDTSDFLIASEALRQHKPILGICRGEQLMNVMLGGSLVQDIPSQVGGKVSHSKGAIHKIGVEKESVLYELFGKDSLTVNSYHHQAVNIPGKDVKVTARASDGVVEAYEAPGVTAVQFHPEKLLAGGDEQWLKFFIRFLSMKE